MSTVVNSGVRPVPTTPTVTAGATTGSATTPAAGAPSTAAATFTMDRANVAVRAYLANPTNVATLSLNAARSGLGGAALLARGLPVVGNILNAAAALVGAAKACVHTSALLAHNPAVYTADVVADWARVATDVAGIFFPPVGLAGAVGNVAYNVYDAVATSRAASGK